MHKELLVHGKILCGRVFDWNGKPLTITKVDFRETFEHEATKYISAERDKLTAEAKILERRKRYLNFLPEVISQVHKQLPASHDLFKTPSVLPTEKVLDASKIVGYNQLQLPHLRQEND